MFWSDGSFACTIDDTSERIIKTYIQDQGYSDVVTLIPPTSKLDEWVFYSVIGKREFETQEGF